MGTRQRASRAVAGFATAAALLAVLAACSTGSNTAASGGSGGSAGGADRAAPGKAVAGSAAPRAAPDPSQAQDVAALPRALVRTADVTVRVANVDQAAQQVGAYARGAGGMVFGDDRYGSGDTAKADIVIKVEPGRLDGVLGSIAALGTKESLTSSTEDVTEQVADVDSRVASMKASIARVRTLLSRANSVADLVSAEGELTRREADLESLEARQRALAGQVALATVTVHLLARQAPAPAKPAGQHSFGSGLAGGWRAFTAAVGWTLAALGALLPFLLLALVVLVGWRIAAPRLRRLSGARRAPDLPRG
jgi:Domain of unknown function (DUF4349)